jgi:RimJ/RimL family protein N-acetyltransferase
MIDFNQGLHLSKLTKEDVAQTFIWRNDYSIWKWCRQNDALDSNKHIKWYEKISSDPSIEMYGIFSGPLLLGVCGLTDIDRINQRAEFSLYIAPECQGKGYAKPALKTLLAHGFMNQNINTIWGETFDGNHAYKMFIDLGMQYEGTRRNFYYKEGRFIDAHLVSITKEEFMRSEWKQSQV